MGPDASKLGLLAGQTHDVIDGLSGELGLPLGHKQPGQIVFAGGEIALDGTQLVAGNRVLDTKAALETRDPKQTAFSAQLSVGCARDRCNGSHAHALANDNLTDLDLRRDVCVVGNVTHDLRAMSTDPLLKVRCCIEVQMTSGNEWRRRTWTAARHAFIDFVANHPGTLKSIHNQGQVLAGVIVVVKALAGFVWVKNCDTNHAGFLSVDRIPRRTVGLK
jgi:hypothetical protein